MYGDSGLVQGDNFLTYEELPRDIVRRANYTDTADTGDDYLCSLCYVVDPDGVIYVTDAVYSREPMEMTEGLVGTMLRESGTRAALIESNNGGRGICPRGAGFSAAGSCGVVSPVR